MRGLLLGMVGALSAPAAAGLVAALAAPAAAASGIDLSDLPPRKQVAVICSVAAAIKQGVPANILLAVAEIEGGRPGQWVRNANGTYDVGPMQLNTRYLADLQRRYGVTAAAAASGGCYPYELAAWRLSKHLRRDKGDLLTRAANYHSRTPRHNRKYRRKLKDRSLKWKRWLDRRFGTPKREAPRPHAAAAAVTREQDAGDLLGLLGGTADDGPCRSVGRPHAGRLRGGVQVPRHRGYIIRDPRRSWATTSTVQWLTRAFDEAGGLGPRARVLDLSLRRGGPMRGHRSHQSGRDVDLTYYRRSCQGPCELRATTAPSLDAVRQWRLLQGWLRRGEAEFIFIDYRLQAPLYRAALRAGASEAQLHRWFQYPRGKDFRGGIVRHVDHHDDHLHVRFRCAQRDEGCRSPGRAVAASTDEASTEDEGPGWMQLITGDGGLGSLMELLE